MRREELRGVELRVHDGLAQIGEVERRRGVIGDDERTLAKDAVVVALLPFRPFHLRREGEQGVRLAHERVPEKLKLVAEPLGGTEQTLVAKQLGIESEIVRLHVGGVPEHAVAPPGGHECDHPPARALVAQQIVPRKPREHHLVAQRVALARADGCALARRARHEQVGAHGVLSVHRGDVVFGHAVLQKRKAHLCPQVAKFGHRKGARAAVCLRGGAHLREQVQQQVFYRETGHDLPLLLQAGIVGGVPVQHEIHLSALCGMRVEIVKERLAVVSRRVVAVGEEPDTAHEGARDAVKGAQGGAEQPPPAPAAKRRLEARFGRQMAQKAPAADAEGAAYEIDEAVPHRAVTAANSGEREELFKGNGGKRQLFPLFFIEKAHENALFRQGQEKAHAHALPDDAAVEGAFLSRGRALAGPSPASANTAGGALALTVSSNTSLLSRSYRSCAAASGAGGVPPVRRSHISRAQGERNLSFSTTHGSNSPSARESFSAYAGKAAPSTERARSAGHITCQTRSCASVYCKNSGHFPSARTPSSYSGKVTESR